MAFGSVQLVPGVNVERTPTLLRAGYSASNLIRWRDSLAQKLGGWQQFYPLSLSGVPRDLHAWEDLDLVSHLAVGTTGAGTVLVVLTNGERTTITPQQLISNFSPNFSTVINTPNVTIVDPNISNVTIFDAVFFATPISVGGLILDGLYPITEILGSDSYAIDAGTNATSTVNNGGAVPAFTTTSGSSEVEVAFANNGTSVGDRVVFFLPTTVGGLIISGGYAVANIVDVNDFDINASTVAGSNATVSMNGGDAQLIYQIALGPPPSGFGFGLGGFGDGGFGTGAGTGSQQQGTPITATDWTSDNWGEILIECPKNGGIYYYDPTGGFQNASIITGALISGGPLFNTGIFISTSEQILIAYGSTIKEAIGLQQQPLLVQWSDVGNFLQWDPTVEGSQAGSFPIPIGSSINAGLAVANQNLLWTDLDLWAMSYIGPPDVFGFNQVGAGMGAVSGHAVQALRGGVYWMSQSNFCSYGANGAQVVPCPVWDAVFQNLNTDFLQNVRSMPNTPFNEAGFLFPSNSSVSGECDSYVKFNIVEQGAPWDYAIGTLPRSAWIDQSVLGMPIGASPQGIIYQHETGFDAAGQPLMASFTTGMFYLEEGENLVVVDQILPDFKWGLFDGVQSAQVQMTFTMYNTPTSAPYSSFTFTVTSTSGIISCRMRGRLMSITVSSSDIGSFWRLGSCKYRYTLSGRR
jgi:hypothetical protein